MNAIDILLLRHCEAQGQEPSAPLTSRGKAQAEELGRMLPNLPISRIFSSPYVRARDSVLSFAENSGLSVNLDERLIERDLGAQNRDDWRSVLEHSFENIDFRCTNGETSREAIVRARDLIDTVASPQLTLFATHGNLYTLILESS